MDDGGGLSLADAFRTVACCRTTSPLSQEPFLCGARAVLSRGRRAERAASGATCAALVPVASACALGLSRDWDVGISGEEEGSEMRARAPMAKRGRAESCTGGWGRGEAICRSVWCVYVRVCVRERERTRAFWGGSSGVGAAAGDGAARNERGVVFFILGRNNSARHSINCSNSRGGASNAGRRRGELFGVGINRLEC